MTMSKTNHLVFSNGGSNRFDFVKISIGQFHRISDRIKQTTRKQKKKHNIIIRNLGYALCIQHHSNKIAECIQINTALLNIGSLLCKEWKFLRLLEVASFEAPQDQLIQHHQLPAYLTLSKNNTHPNHQICSAFGSLSAERQGTPASVITSSLKVYGCTRYASLSSVDSRKHMFRMLCMGKHTSAFKAASRASWI